MTSPWWKPKSHKLSFWLISRIQEAQYNLKRIRKSHEVRKRKPVESRKSKPVDNWKPKPVKTRKSKSYICVLFAIFFKPFPLILLWYSSIWNEGTIRRKIDRFPLHLLQWVQMENRQEEDPPKGCLATHFRKIICLGGFVLLIGLGSALVSPKSNLYCDGAYLAFGLVILMAVCVSLFIHCTILLLVARLKNDPEPNSPES